MGTILSTPPIASATQAAVPGDAPDWDAIIDQAGPAGPLDRHFRPGPYWQVITGMRVDLADALQRARDASDASFSHYRLLIFADTVVARHDALKTIAFDWLTTVVVIGRRLETNAILHLEHSEGPLTFGFYMRQVDPAGCQMKLTRHFTWDATVDGSVHRAERTGDLDDPLKPQVTWSFVEIERDDPNLWPYQVLPMEFSLMPMGACLPLLERMLFAGQWLAAQGQGERAIELLGRLQDLLALRPEQEGWQALALSCASVLELLQPVRLDPDQVPYLSASFYGDVARDHVPTLQAYSGSYARLADRNVDLETRRQAARRVLGEKDDAGAFQKLVAAQLAENLRLATTNVKRAQDAMEPQGANVRRAEAAFKAGLAAWQAAKEAEAAWAIAGAVFAFASGVGEMFAGNGSGAASAAKAAADVASTASKLADIMKKLVKVGQAIEKIVKMCIAIVAAADKISDAGKFASDLSAINRETLTDDAKGAPSAGAYWDQLWVEVETQLAPAIKEGVGGAEEYLKELKILVIYGRALTTAQAALPPLIQEIARSRLQTEIAARQHAAVLSEIEALKQGEILSAHAMVLLWGNYRAMQRSLLVALNQFDAAWRYWALDDTVVVRDNYRGIADLAEDLKAVGDLRQMQARALENFKPPPQEYRRAARDLSAPLRDALLNGERIGLRLTPADSPLSGWGLSSRVRVSEIHLWVQWAPGKRPTRGAVEFTVRTSGTYDDRRLVDKQAKAFHFQGPPVDLTFRYDLGATPADLPGDAVRVRAAIAEDFRASYSEPTLYTDWILSTPKVSAGDADTVDLAKLKADITGIRVEFSGTYIKDPDRMA